jgi:hypothetical protein
MRGVLAGNLLREKGRRFTRTRGRVKLGIGRMGAKVGVHVEQETGWIAVKE